MIKKLLVFAAMAYTSYCTAQRKDFDRAINSVSSDIAQKLQRKGVKRIVVLFITDIDKKITSAGKYLADAVSNNLVNDTANFSLFDRDNLNGIEEAKNLINAGYLDQPGAEELGRKLNVDVIIIGTYTLLSNTITLTLKALSSSNGFVIASSMRDLPFDADAGALLGITVIPNSQGGKSNPNSASGEVTGRTSNDPDCKEKQIGDYCFVNNTNKNLIIYFRASNGAESKCSIQPGQKQCFYNLNAGAGHYSIGQADFSNGGGYYRSNQTSTVYHSEGSVYVEVCQAKEFVIR